MHSSRKLRIAIDCQITDAQQGIGTAFLALANALSQSQRNDQEYTFLVRREIRDWLLPYIFGPCRLQVIGGPQFPKLRRAVRSIAPIRFLWSKLRSRTFTVPASDGSLESGTFDLVHFPTQLGYLTNLPSIYQPWDLQHLHYPQFFSKAGFNNREKLYRALCKQAAFVCVQTEWTKQDVMQNYAIAPEKVVVIRWGSVFDAYVAPSDDAKQGTLRKYGLPKQFFFYPAVTWPHKNHECIIRALEILKRDSGRASHVYFTGGTTEFRSKLDDLARELRVADQLHYLGFVTPEELQAISASATAMIFPSRFEGFGLPILEAFQARVPVLCSKASVLPEVAQDGAAYFDPESPAELAPLMLKALDDSSFRKTLIEKGTETLSKYSMKDTAANFQALYARTAELRGVTRGR